MAILVFGIPVLLIGPGLWPSLIYGTLGAVATYGLLLLLTRVPRLFPENLERQMQGLYDFASSYSPLVLVLLSLFDGVGEEPVVSRRNPGLADGAYGSGDRRVGGIRAVRAGALRIVHRLSGSNRARFAPGCSAYALSESLALVMTGMPVYR